MPDDVQDLLLSLYSGIILWGLGDHVGYWGLNPGQLCAKPARSLLSYLLGLILTHAGSLSPADRVYLPQRAVACSGKLYHGHLPCECFPFVYGQWDRLW